MGTHRFAPCAALATLICLVLAGPATAIPLVGDETRIDLTADLAGAGIDVGLTGGASLDGVGDLVLPVTGGDVTIPLLVGTVEHDGSGFLLSPSGPSLLQNIRFENLEIDLLDLVVRADVSSVEVPIAPGNYAVFDARACLTATGVDPCLDDDGSILLNGFGLDWTETAAGLVNTVLGGAIQAGDALGVAYVDLRFVPEPASAALLGLGLLALARRRSR